MLRVYAAWAEDMVESDVEAIQRSMRRHARLKPSARCRSSAADRLRHRDASAAAAGVACQARTRQHRALGNLAVGLPVGAVAVIVSHGFRKEIYSGKGGTRTAESLSQISNLLMSLGFLSRPFPSNPRFWHSIWHWS